MNLEESYERDKDVFNQLMNQSPIGIGIVNRNGDLIDCNKALGKILGYSCEEIKDMNFEDFTYPDDLEREYQLIEEMWAGKRDRYKIKKRYIHKNGQIIWIELVGSVIRNEDGNPKLGFSFIQDITERVKAKRELKRSKEYFEGILQDQTELIVRWKPKGVLTFVNDSYCKFFDKSPEELLGKTFFIFIPKEDRHLINENIEKITIENPIASHEHRVIKPDGSIGWTEWINRGVFNEEGEITEYQSVGRDITKRKEREKQLRRAKQRSEFYKDLLAHDIRNILNNIKLSTQLIRLEENKPTSKAKKQEALNIVDKQIERGSSLITNVRAFSILNNQEQEIKSVDFKAMILKAIEDAKTRFSENNLEIITNLPDDLSQVKAGDMLYNAFENLILNGLMHNRSEIKKIWIKASEVQHQDGLYVKIEFIDNGIGISEKRKKTIFHRTYDKENLTGGMGIGLSLVNKIIELYDGKIEVKNRIEGDPSQGSIFILYLKQY